MEKIKVVENKMKKIKQLENKIKKLRSKEYKTESERDSIADKIKKTGEFDIAFEEIHSHNFTIEEVDFLGSDDEEILVNFKFCCEMSLKEFFELIKKMKKFSEINRRGDGEISIVIKPSCISY